MDQRHDAWDGAAISSSFLDTRLGFSKGQVRFAAQVPLCGIPVRPRESASPAGQGHRQRDESQP